MNTALTSKEPAESTPPQPSNEPDTPIAASDRLVLWMFLLGVFLFIALLLGEVFAGFFQ
jgi:hypothetical protein